jgi:Fe-S cluster biogenesis protein NfuA|tara:strand:- start:3545 stop:4141 length:597 start_codon:yes stop_codon:yes gene_type:complete
MKVPVTVYAEMTPNPRTMKFVANKYLLVPGDSVEFTSMAEAKGFSPMAETLFNFPFVKGVFIAANFVTITISDDLSWDYVQMELREFLKDWLQDGKDVLIQMPQPKPVETKSSVEGKEYAPSEYDDAIKDLLDEFVRPAVENDGGAIDFRSFEEGTVTVVLRGACSGCPSSTATLKGGIETLLKSHLPAVKEVVAEEA